MPTPIRDWRLSTKLTAIYSLVMLAAISLLAYGLFWELRAAQRQGARERLEDILRFASPQIDAGAQALIQSPADENTEYYLALTRRLGNIRATSAVIARIYTLRPAPGGGLVYVVDTAPGHAQVGQPYPALSPALAPKLLNQSKLFVEDDLRADSGGVSLRGFAPIGAVFSGAAPSEGWLVIELDASSVVAYEAQAAQIALVTLLIMTPLGLLLVWGVGRRLLRPLAGLARAAESVAQGRLETRLPVTGRDEIGQLAETFNSMTQQLETTLTALQQNEARFRSVVENASDVSLLLDARGTCLYVSLPVERLFGYAPASLVGHPFRLYIHPDDWPGVLTVGRQALERPYQPLGVEFRLQHANRSWRYVEALGSNRLADPAVGGITVMLRDVTERKHAQAVQAALSTISEAALLAETVEQLSACIHDVIGGLMPAENFYIALADPATGQLTFSYFADEHLGLQCPSPAAQNLTVYVVQTGETLLASPKTVAHLMQTGMVSGTAEGPVDWLGVPLKARDRTIGVLAVQSYAAGGRYGAQDEAILEFVSTQVAMALERKRAEEAHRNSERRLADIINYLPDAAMVIDTRHRIIAWNRAMEELTGVRAGEMLGVGDYVYALPFYGVCRPMLLDYALERETDILPGYSSLRIEGEMLTGEARIVGRGGHATHLWGKAAPLRDAEGTIVGAIETVRDVTARVEADEALRQRNRELALLHRIVADATSTLEPHTVLATALGELAQGLETPYGCAALVSDDRSVLTIVAEYQPQAAGGLLGEAVPLVEARTAGCVLEQVAPVAAADVAGEPRLGPVRDLLCRQGLASMLMVPLAVRGQTLGLMGLATHVPREFTAAEMKLAGNAAAAVAQAIENARLFAKTAESLERERRLREVAYTISGVLDLPSALQTISRLTTELTGADGSALSLLGPDGQTFDQQYQYLFNLPQELHGADVMPRGQGGGLAATVAATRQSLLVDNYQVYPGAQQVWVERGVHAFIGVPLVAGDVCLGALGVFSMQPQRRFTARDLALAESVGRLAGVAVQNARLFEEARRRTEELEGLLQLSATLRQKVTHGEMLPVILEQTLALLKAQGAALALRDLSSGEIVAALGTGAWAHWTGERLSPAEGLTAWVMQTGQPFLSNDLAHEPQFSRPELLNGLTTVVSAPLIAYDYAMGVLGAGRQTPWQESDLKYLSAIADVAAGAIHNATLYEQTDQRLRRLIALRTIDLTITANQNLRVTLNILLEQTITQLGVDAAAVLLFKAQTQSLEYAASLGFRTALKPRPLRLGEGYAGRAALERRLIHVAQLAAAPAGLAQVPQLAAEGFCTYYGVPLEVKGQVKGVLEVYSRTPLTPDLEWNGFLEALAGQTAIAVDNATLFDDLQHSNQELQQAYDRTLEGWSRALDLRDKETEGHTQRVTELTLRLAQAMGLSEADSVQIRRGALLHDIGKMGIPDSILLKASPLSPEETAIMRRHPEYAYELLSPISYLAAALEIPYAHHEKWDGSGYPRGLRGAQIPLAARLFAVADVWDALCSDRPYHKAWPRAQALAYLKAESGRYFDPRVVTAFLRLVEDGEPHLSDLPGGEPPAA